MSNNPYLPKIAQIIEIIPETDSNDVKTFRLMFPDDPELKSFSYLPGQFAEISLLGIGETPISITSSPTQKNCLEFSVKKTGKVTTALHNSTAGDFVGIRGPYGNYFHLPKDKNIFFIGGGIGISHIRSLLNYIISPEQRANCKKISLLYGARSKGDLVFKWEFSRWSEQINLYLTVDRKTEGWTGRIGFVPSVLMDIAPSSENTVVVTCGPPVMIKFVIQNLLKLGFSPSQIIITLEMKMKCGIGKCGRCNIGHLYVCKDGPAFTYEQLQKMPNEY